MKISWVRSSYDKDSFKIFKGMGFSVFELDNPEDTDLLLNELVEENYSTIVISNEIAGFSGDIVKKYAKSRNVNIIITPTKRE